LNFSNGIELLEKFNNIVTSEFKNRNDTYNYKYLMSNAGKNNIKNGIIKQTNYKYQLKYPNFKYNITGLDTSNYIIKNYCDHGDLIIKKDKFDKIYNLRNQLYCEICLNSYIEKMVLSKNEINENINIYIELLKNKKTYQAFHRESFLKYYYPIIYKSILLFTEQNNCITFSEKLYLFKNKLQTKPKCLCNNCCNLTVYSNAGRSFTVYCPEHFYSHNTSIFENEIKNYIISLISNEIIKQNDRHLRKELDIYIPSLNLAFEYNSFYYHSDNNKSINKYYHYNKWKLCNDNEIDLVSIWEDDWRYKKEIVKSIIKDKLNLSQKINVCHNFEIKLINENTKYIFLNNNHIDGNCESDINLGLYSNNNLLSIMCFKNIKKSNLYKLSRYCCVINNYVINSEKLLFNYFITNFLVHKILGHLNLSATSNLYTLLKFKFIKYNPPVSWKIVNKKRYVYLNSDYCNKLWDIGYKEYSWYK
jgi:hypothetical protein